MIHNIQKTHYGDVPIPDGISSRVIDDVNGLKMHILSSSPDTKKRPLVLLMHGFPEIAYSWRYLLPRIAALGYTVVAPDQRGYGRTEGWSNRYDDSIRPFNFVNLTRDAVALVRALGYDDVHAIIGHDSGSFVAGTCALIRPDLFQSCVMMSAPFTGAGPLGKDSGSLFNPPSIEKIESSLNSLTNPRKHYQVYFSSKHANSDLMNAPQGIHDFLRAYYHHKSADWPGNQPYELESWDAASLAQMPTYYVMNNHLTMPQTVAEHMPPQSIIDECSWLPDEHLEVYVSEYKRNSFQGGLQWYRCMIEGVNAAELSLFSGRTIDVPSLFISGANDWGIYQAPGAINHMRDYVCAEMRDIILIDNAGHWVQQEQHDAVFDGIASFLKTN